MILRSVIDHVKAQNWTAIFIDFVIVVLGVFVGIQVSNWNAERALRATEESHLAQLRDELAENVRLLDSHTVYTRDVVGSGRRALAFLESDGDCGETCAGLVIDFFQASQLWGTPYPRSIYDENVRLGFPSDEATRARIDLYYLNIAGWNPINLTPPPFRNTIRGYFSPDAAAALWGECFDVPEDQLEIMTRDCEDEIRADDAAAMLRAIHADGKVANELRFWIGQNIFALDEFSNTRRAGVAAIAALTGDGESAQ